MKNQTETSLNRELKASKYFISIILMLVSITLTKIPFSGVYLSLALFFTIWLLLLIQIMQSDALIWKGLIIRRKRLFLDLALSLIVYVYFIITFYIF